jgi:hypothetical protein
MNPLDATERAFAVTLSRIYSQILHGYSVSSLRLFARRLGLLLALCPLRTQKTPSEKGSEHEQIHSDDQSFREFGWAHGCLSASLSPLAPENPYRANLSWQNQIPEVFFRCECCPRLWAKSQLFVVAGCAPTDKGIVIGTQLAGVLGFSADHRWL